MHFSMFICIAYTLSWKGSPQIFSRCVVAASNPSKLGILIDLNDPLSLDKLQKESNEAAEARRCFYLLRTD